jgi:hypothetical protein
VSFFQGLRYQPKFPLTTGSSYSGTAEDYDEFIYACFTNAQNQCTAFSIDSDPTQWCPGPKPGPPPVPNQHKCCASCMAQGGICKAGGPAGCTCNLSE